MKQLLYRISDVNETQQQVGTLKEELSVKAYKNILFHLYSGSMDRQLLVQVCAKIREMYPDSLIAGTLSGGEIKDGRLMGDGILISVMLFEKADIRLERYDRVKGSESETGSSIAAAIDNMPDIKAAELMLPGTSFRTAQILDEMSSCREDVQVFGGYAGGRDLSCEEHFVFNDEGCFDDSIFLILYAGRDFHIDADNSVGWKTLGMPFKVTKAEDNRLITINDRPAVEIYEKYLSISRDDEFAENTFEFPLIAEVENDELLRHTITVDDEGALILAGYVKEGMNILLSYGNPTSIVERVNDRLETVRKFVPEAVLLYSCSVRKSFWESFVDIEMLPFEELAPTAGFFTWGEVMRNRKTGSVLEYNITLLSIAMREGDAGSAVNGPVRVDDSVLKGQASLIKRLSQLVSATTVELQKAFEVMSEMNEKLLEMSIRDALTGLYNRARTESLINEAIDRAHATNDPVSLIMLDIDYFKKVNDTYGHAVGDDVLKAVSLMLGSAACSCPGGNAGRWGGEEFFVVLPGTDRDQAFSIAESLRKSIADFDFPTVHKLTVSMGLITTTGGHRKDIFTKVDDALYMSKQNGRNRVTVVGQE